MSQKKRILIIDDHPLFREGLKTIIGNNPEYKTVMPDLIRHPEAIKFTGFRLSPE